MNTIQHSFTFVGLVLAATVLAGLIVRRRLSASRAFGLYLLVVTLVSAAYLTGSTWFLSPEHWLLKEAVYATLRLAVAVELMLHTFRRFPGAMVRSRRLLVLLGVAIVGATAVPLGSLERQVLLGQALPRLTYGTAWLFTALGALVLWYHVPLRAMHKAILIGFVPYLLTFSLVLHSLQSFGWVQHHLAAGYANSAAYNLMLAYWACIAWRRARVEPVDDGRHWAGLSAATDDAHSGP